MLVLQPKRVTFGGAVWETVRAVMVDRVARRVVREWGDSGPHVRYVDVSEQEVAVRVVLEMDRADLAGPVLGTRSTLRCVLSPNASDAGEREVRVECVVTGVRHGWSERAGGVTRTIELVGVSSDGLADPLVVTRGGIDQ